MASQVYPPNVIVRTILGDFFPARGLAPAPRGLGSEAPPVFDDDRIISDMEKFFYVRLDATRAAPRGARDWVVVLVLSAAGKYSNHSPDLHKLLDAVETERPAKEGRLDELIVVADKVFFGKKNLTDVVRGAQKRQARGGDEKGTAPFFSMYPYHNFALVVPEHHSVPRHRTMTAAEVDAMLTRDRIERASLPVIFTSDAAIVWSGAREGQVVEITRGSQTAGVALYYRRVERDRS